MDRFILEYHSKAETDGFGAMHINHENEKKSSRIEWIAYGSDHAKRTDIRDLSAIAPEASGVNWVRVVGTGDTGVIEQAGALFHIHGLVLEDIIHGGQRTKIEYYEGHTFLAFNILYKDTAGEPVQQQVSVLEIGNTIVTFEEAKTGLFEPIIERILDERGIIRRQKACFLVYCLIDAIVDAQFVLLGDFEERMDRLEEDIAKGIHKGQAQAIYALKRELIGIRNSIWPMQDVVDEILSGEGDLDRNLRSHYRDVADHIKRLMGYITAYRELVMGMYEAYLSNINSRMNRIITTLTVFSVTFIPLTFLSGVYGMNFRFFPELNWKWAYPAFWLVCIGIAVGMIAFFKKKKWL